MRPLFLLTLLFSAISYAATFNAATCGETDVAAAIASAIAAGAGNTVAIPSGTCTWTTNLTTPASGTMPNITISGNTVCAGSTPASCADNTVIQSNGSARWFIVTNAGTTTTLSGLTFRNSGAVTNGVVNVQGPASGTVPQVRITQIHGDMASSTDTTFTIASIVGVIDHSVFDETASTEGNSIRFFYPLSGDSGDQSWANSTGLGGPGYMYVENCTFNHGVANDGQEGARFVFRFDVFNDTSVQTHPTGGDGRGRGARAWEVYNNSFNAVGGCSVECGNAMFLSSGTGLVWGNTATSVYGLFMGLHSMRVDNATYSQGATPGGWGYCGTNFNGSGSNWDQNTNAASGYRCLDQPGSGVGDLLTGNFPSVVNSTTGTIAWPNQALEPVYEWSNTWAGSTGTYAVIFGQASTCSPSCSGGSLLQSNRDYYLWCNAGSTNGCTSAFDGTVGTGSGLLSSRPATCTVGVAYWSTDQSILYKCASSNVWSNYYTPYTYPHPLDIVTGSTGTSRGGPVSVGGPTSQ